MFLGQDFDGGRESREAALQDLQPISAVVSPGCGGKKRILIADDNAAMRRQIRKILEFDGSMVVCTEASDGVEAVRKTRDCSPDLAVLDLLMPNLNGLEAAREMKKFIPALPILLFTLHNSPQLEQEGRRAGIDAIVGKMQGCAQLAKKIHSLLDEH